MQAKLLIELKIQLFKKIDKSTNRLVVSSFYLYFYHTISWTVISKISIWKLVRLDEDICDIS